MKKILLFLTIFTTIPILIASPNSSDTALDCSLQYQAEGSLFWGNASGESGMRILSTTDTKTLSNSYYNAHTVRIDALSIRRQDYFRISISTQAGEEIYNATSKWAGAEVTLPVDFFDGDENGEDPPHIIRLKLTCEEQSLAG